MTATPSRRLALLYDPAIYQPTVQKPTGARTGLPTGFLDRQLIARAALDGLLAGGNWSELTLVVRTQAAADAAREVIRGCLQIQMGQRTGRVVTEAEWVKAINTQGATEAPRQLVSLDLPDMRLLWARRQAGGASASFCAGLSGSPASLATVQAVANLVAAPVLPHDALVCSSRAAAEFVRTTTGQYADYLRERFGGKPELSMRIEVLPPSLAPESFPIPTPQEIQQQRQALKLEPDEIVVLWAGQLGFHMRAHPAPVYLALSEAARATGKRVHLLIAGWAVREPLLSAFLDGARIFLPNVRISMVEGDDPARRPAVWQAADLLAVTDDSIHDHSGLPILQAMAAGLPVLASDWGIARDLVVDGQTGLLIPTYQIRGATSDLPLRLLFGLEYEPYLAECNQTVAVDVPATVQAFTRLLTDADLRKRLGQAGRQRLLERFAPAVVTRGYEDLWAIQERERSRKAPPTGKSLGTVPAPEDAFGAFPSVRLGEKSRLQAVPDTETRVLKLQTMPLTNYAEGHRVLDYLLLREVLAKAAEPQTVAALADLFAKKGFAPVLARSTLGWLLKYGLLRVVDGSAGSAG